MLMQFLILFGILGLLPLVVGGIPGYVRGEKFFANLPLRWVCGQFLLWAGFQVIAVPLILQQKGFDELLLLYGCYLVALFLLLIGLGLKQRAKQMKPSLVLRDMEFRDDGARGSVAWVIFWGLLAYQLIQAIRMVYADGDDAFYVATSAVTVDADTMYQKLPYTGGETVLDARHGLAPFPIWIAFLAKVSGMHVATTAHIAVPIAMIGMTYACFYILGKRMLGDNGARLPLFLIFTELLVLFGDSSRYTMENFLIARSRQGKAALGSIVIPFLLYLLLALLQRLKEKEHGNLSIYLLLFATSLSACLCSTLGAFLVALLVAIVGILAAICYRSVRMLLPMAVSCAPCVVYAMLYVICG